MEADNDGDGDGVGNGNCAGDAVVGMAARESVAL